MEKSGLQNAALVLEGGSFHWDLYHRVLDYLMEQGCICPMSMG